MAGRKQEDLAIFTPIIQPRLIHKRLKNGKYQMTPTGLEQRCSTCGEYWPVDTEFFYSNRDDLHCHCKACYDFNRRMKRNAKKVAA